MTVARGTVVRLQVQRVGLKVKGVGYDPRPILSVGEAAVGALGVAGHSEGSWVLDVHHAAHPQARGGGNRGVSIGFTSHHAAMVERFPLTEFGVSGENLIVESRRMWSLGDLADGVVIEAAAGGIALRSPRVAAPCAEFTSFLLGRGHVARRDEISAEMAFLDGGTRGFVVDASHLRRPAIVRVGDPVRIGV